MNYLRVDHHNPSPLKREKVYAILSCMQIRLTQQFRVNPDSLRENHPGGSQTEFLTVYSIVNSLALNIPQISSVKILIEGRETMTIAGHIDSRFPFKANMILVR